VIGLIPKLIARVRSRRPLPYEHNCATAATDQGHRSLGSPLRANARRILGSTCYRYIIHRSHGNPGHTSPHGRGEVTKRRRQSARGVRQLKSGRPSDSVPLIPRFFGTLLAQS
jgi:hypothetical protein